MEMTELNSRDLGDDFIGAVLPIGNIHAVQVSKYQWDAYLNAEDDPSDSIVMKKERANCVRRNMGGRRILQITDDNDEVISGSTRKDLVKNLKKNQPIWWLLYTVYWNRT